MEKLRMSMMAVLFLTLTLAVTAEGQSSGEPKTVEVKCTQKKAIAPGQSLKQQIADKHLLPGGKRR